MKTLFFALKLLLLTNSVWADGVHLKLGPTLNGGNQIANKMVGLGYSHKLSKLFLMQEEIGSFSTLTGKQLGYGGISIGLEIKGDTLYSKFFTGPVYVSETNEYLSSNLNVMTDLEVGIHDSRDINFGIGYKHLSNAGIVGPNLGRDFLYLKVGVPIW